MRSIATERVHAMWPRMSFAFAFNARNINHRRSALGTPRSGDDV
jgi:hypothetical protein